MRVIEERFTHDTHVCDLLLIYIYIVSKNRSVDTIQGFYLPQTNVNFSTSTKKHRNEYSV